MFHFRGELNVVLVLFLPLVPVFCFSVQWAGSRTVFCFHQRCFPRLYSLAGVTCTYVVYPTCSVLVHVTCVSR